MPFAETRHLLTISALTPKELCYLVDRAMAMKARPQDFTSRCANKTLLALFAKPSLRTRVSLETAMTKLGGHTIYYELGANSNIGGKESVEDTAEVISRMVDVCSARIATKEMMRELAHYASIPCINALDNWAHPLQMVCDFLTIKEKFTEKNEFQKGFKGIKMAYCGDSYNNVTYDIMRACSLLGMECHICCPDHPDFKPPQEVLDECAEITRKYNTGACVKVFHDCIEGCRGVDVVYTDSWMSYHISKEEKEARLKVLTPYQVTDAVMAVTSERSIFMNCLPATRGEEQTASVIDGPKSVCYDEAGNRLWSAMAVLDFLTHQFIMEK